MTLDSEKPTNKILLVGIPQGPAESLKEKLSGESDEFHTLRISSEITPEAIVESVTAVKPDLLIIETSLPPRLGLSAETPLNFESELTDRNNVSPRPVGIEAVELLRRESDLPVLYIHTCQVYGDTATRERMIQTHPKGILDPTLPMKAVSALVRFSLETADIDMETCQNTYGSELKRVKKTAALINLGDVLQQAAIDSQRRSDLLLSFLEDLLTRELMKKLFFHFSFNAIFLKNTHLRYEMVNVAMSKLLNAEVSDIINKTDEDLLKREEAERFKSAEERVLAGEEVEQLVTWPLHGLEKTFLDSRVPRRSPDGRIIGIYGILRDITYRQRISSERFFPIADEYSSQAMQECLKNALRAAKKDSIVLLLGESGSGKDYVARYIHDHSQRKSGPYFSINCAAVSPELAESELFGHEKGAFTGAVDRKRGLLELAEGGTLLLNEIGELSAPLQAKLLTFLDTKKFTRVGGEKEESVNARIIAATNRDLATEVEEGRFRKDVFYRINVFSISVPPLRDRSDDIPKLVEEIMQRLRNEMQLEEIAYVTPDGINTLLAYGWPGNVRELRNVLERNLLQSSGTKLDIGPLQSQTDSSQTSPQVSRDFALRSAADLTDEEFAEMYLETCVKKHGEKGARGSAITIAGVLGCSRETVSRRINKPELELPEVKKGRSSKAAREKMIRELESWLERHGFERAHSTP